MSNNTRYKIMQGTYWMIYCMVVSFRVTFLNGRGMGTTEIGVMTAVFGVIAAMIQPVFGRMSDNDPKLTWRRMILCLCIPMPVILVLMMLIPGKLSAGIMMGLLYLLTCAFMPFINSAPYYYEQKGETINFGMARGTGSATFAVLSLIAGAMVKQSGINAIPVLSVVTVLLFAVNTYLMPCEPMARTERNGSGKRSAGVLRKYPAFTVMFVSCLLMMTSHNMTGTYLLQIIQTLGGDSSHLGVALAIPAIAELPVLFGYSYLKKHISSEVLLVVAGCGFFLKSILFLMSGSVTMIYLAQLTQLVSFAVYASASVYFVVENINAEDQTTGQAWMTSTIVAGMVIGGLLGGYLFEHMGMRAMLICNSIITAATIPTAAVATRLARIH
ncbi:MAG: MFS transporter [Clostridia bacterium]|nr:MFS transporter [Clostridia bacterium]